MYKIDVIICVIAMILLTFLSFKLEFQLNINDISNIITFLSIYFGFVLTSFSIMTNNDEIKKLRNKPDSEDNFLTLLERLSNYYKFNIFCSIITILILLIINPFKIYFYVSILIPGFIFIILYSGKTILKILFDLFLDKKVVK